MDSAYLQRVRFQLQKRFRRLNSCPVMLFHSSLTQFWNYLHGQTITAGILAKLDTEAAKYSEELETLHNRHDMSIFETEREQFHFTYRVIQYCVGEPLSHHMGPEEKIGRALSSSSKRSEALDAFREHFLEPFYEYVDDALDQQGAVLSLLVKYRHKVEWFEREGLRQLASGDERQMAKHLYAFLFDQGLEFHIEPQSVSGEADLVAPELVLDAKVFDGARRGLTYLASGVHQVHTYARDFNQEVGYLVIFKTCPETIDFTFSSAGQLAPYVTVGGKTIYLMVVDICDHGASASKRGPMKVYSVEQEFLVRPAEAIAESSETPDPAA
jgi:hypothetical protein